MLIKDVAYRAQQRKILKCVRTAREVVHFDETLLLMLVKKHPVVFLFICSFLFCFKLMLIIRLILKARLERWWKQELCIGESKDGAVRKARLAQRYSKVDAIMSAMVRAKLTEWWEEGWRNGASKGEALVEAGLVLWYEQGWGSGESIHIPPRWPSSILNLKLSPN